MKADKTNLNNINPQGISWYHPAFLIATWFGVGKIPFAPGTFGSIAAFPLFIFSHLVLCLANNENSFVADYVVFLMILFLIGQWASNVYMKKTGKQDPGEVVIDEVLGQLIVWFSALYLFAPYIGIYDILYGSGTADSQKATVASLLELLTLPEIMRNYIIILMPTYLLGLVLFRIFDIWKPFPIKWCDKNIKNGFGVMFDDIFAAFYACIALLIILMAFFVYFVPKPADNPAASETSTEIVP